MSISQIEEIHDYHVDIKARTLYLFEDIYAESANCHVKNLHLLDSIQGKITIYINTPGGTWDDGMAIYSAIKKCKNEVVGYATGTCSSMGSIILQACDTRIITPECHMVIHPGSTAVEGTVLDVLSNAEHEKYILNQMYNIYYEKMKKTLGRPPTSLKQFKAKYNRDRYVYPDDALRLGLVDEIDRYDK